MYRLKMAVGFLQRARGLIGRPVDYLASDEVLCFVRCASVHTFWMQASIDVAFLDETGGVLKAIRGMPPWRLCGCRGAHWVCERFAQPQSDWFEEGARLCLAADVLQIGR